MSRADTVGADPIAVGLLLLAVVFLGYFIPGGGFIAAVGSLATEVRHSRGALRLLFGVASVLTLVVVVTAVGNLVPPVAHVR